MTGKSFVSYLKYLRVEHAKKLLLETKYPIQDIALQIGYDDERYFRKIFIEITGISPAQFRKKTSTQVENCVQYYHFFRKIAPVIVLKSFV